MGNDSHRNSLKPGYKLHWYEIKKILGQGGFGITYLALDSNLDEEVAIKEYLPIELAVREGDYSVHPVSEGHNKNYKWGLERFISEARTLTKFKHHNIVRVRNVFEDNNTAYMVMEYEHGQSLQEKLSARKTLEEPELLNILIPILGGLEVVHQKGFIHRDIKPDNIFIRQDGSPVLLDFGSARQALGEQTRTLTSLVTPGYAPYEQYYSKSDEQGPWTDIYGLGATLYRAVTGIAPINAVDRSKAILQTSKDTMVPASEISKGKYSDNFLKAIDHSLQFNPEDRPQTIQAWKKEFGVKNDIADVQEPEVVGTRPAQPGTRVVSRHASSGLMVKALLMILSIIVVLGGGYLGWQWYREEQAAKQLAEAEAKRIKQEQLVVERMLEEGRRLKALHPDGEWLFDTKTGCSVWNPNPRPDETVTWSGGCVNGMFSGNGIFQWLENGEEVSRYDGEFINGALNGFVKGHGVDGSRYEGVYKDWLKNGHGIFIWADGSRYEGEFKDDKINGQGYLNYANGNRYEGEFKEDKLNGQGIYIWKNGDRYEGEFKEDKLNGQGILNYANGNRYEGEFKDDKLNGQGIFTWENGDRYEGEFKEEKLNGYGIYNYANGDQYDGEWKDGNRHGYGTYTYNDGTTEKGIWEMDELILKD